MTSVKITHSHTSRENRRINTDTVFNKIHRAPKRREGLQNIIANYTLQIKLSQNERQIETIHVCLCSAKRVHRHAVRFDVVSVSQWTISTMKSLIKEYVDKKMGRTSICR